MQSIDDLKYCYSCEQDLPIKDFWADSSRPDGKCHKCKNCMRQRNTNYRKSNPEKFAAYQLKNACKKHGIKVSDFEWLKKRQKNLCAICQRPQIRGKRLAIDHCHRTGRVRGLLCDGCNGGLGLFGDDPERLQAAIEYILGENYD